MNEREKADKEFDERILSSEKPSLYEEKDEELKVWHEVEEYDKGLFDVRCFYGDECYWIHLNVTHEEAQKIVSEDLKSNE